MTSLSGERFLGPVEEEKLLLLPRDSPDVPHHLWPRRGILDPASTPTTMTCSSTRPGNHPSRGIRSSSSWAARIGAESGYSVDDEFPHLAERLLALQDLVRIQAPDSFWGLMSDRRDVYRFWMGRITLWLGAGVPVLMTLQSTVAVAQLVVCDFEDRPRGSALHYIGRMLVPFFVGNAFCNIRLSCSSTKLLPNIENTCYA